MKGIVFPFCKLFVMLSNLDELKISQKKRGKFLETEKRESEPRVLSKVLLKMVVCFHLALVLQNSVWKPKTIKSSKKSIN